MRLEASIRILPLLTPLVVLGPLACNRAEAEGQPPPPEAIAGAEAEAIFNQRCVACHGTAGKGNGTIASALGVTPRDYTNREWQARVTDEDLRVVILRGGKSTGKSDYMPPNPDLESKPRVVAALITKVRAFGK
jgi:mono/diheme cytochrome c family protein